MMFPSHLVATLLLGLALERFLPGWRGSRDWALLLAFGVAIDLDHLANLPRFVATHGASALFDPSQLLPWGAAWQGFMHSPWAVLAALAASAAFLSPAPALGWCLHMVLDFVVAKRFVVWGSASEWALVAAGAVMLGVLVRLRGGFATLRGPQG